MKDNTIRNAVVKTEIGWIDIGGDDRVVTRLHWYGSKPRENEPTPLLREAARQVEAYMNGRLRQFDLPLLAEGDDFAKSVWREMLAIPYGRTRTYGDVATALQTPAQLVGQACGRNPIAVIIPCHRIVSATSFGGYTSELGLRAKTFLLDLESGQQRLL